MKKIILEVEKWKIIVDFLSTIQIPLAQSANGLSLINAINSAQEVNTEVKEPEKKK